MLVPADHSYGHEGSAEGFAQLGWEVLAIGPGERARLPQVGVSFVLAHPEFGVALVDLAPARSPDPVGRLSRRLDAVGFASSCPEYLPIIHKVLEFRDLWRLSLVLDSSFASERPIGLRGREWIDLLQRALLLEGEAPAQAPVAKPEPAAEAKPRQEAPLVIAPEPEPPVEVTEPEPGTDDAEAPPLEGPMATEAEATPEPAIRTAPSRESPKAPRRLGLHPGWLLLAAGAVAAVGLSHQFQLPQRWMELGGLRRGGETLLPADRLEGGRSEAAPSGRAENAGPPPATLRDEVPRAVATRHEAAGPEAAPRPAADAVTLVGTPRPNLLPPPEAAAPQPPVLTAVPAPVGSVPEPEPALALPPMGPPSVPPLAAEILAPPMPGVHLAVIPRAEPAGPPEPTPGRFEPDLSVAAISTPPAPAAPAIADTLLPATLAPQPASPPAPPAVEWVAPTIEAEPAPVPGPGAVLVATAPGMPAALPPDTIALLVSRGDEMLAHGDISGARLLYARAAAAGSAAASMAMGRSFDPEVLNRLGVRGIRPDPEQARQWYRRAEEAR